MTNILDFEDRAITKHMANKKSEQVTINIYQLADRIVDLTLELSKHADSDNIKNSIKILLDKFEQDYKQINLIYK